MIDSIDGLLTRMCNCKPTDFYVFKPTCWDNTTAKIIALIESNGNYTAQMMADLIVDNIQRQHPPVQYLSNGWVACINPDCDWNLSNQMIMMTVTNDDSSTTSLIIGIVLGLLSVAVIILIIVIAVTWRIRRRYCVYVACKYTNACMLGSGKRRGNDYWLLVHTNSIHLYGYPR